MKRAALICLALACLWQTTLAQPANPIPLAGNWRFALDRGDTGVNDGWFNRRLADSIRLPGTLTGQGIGDDITTNTPWVGGIVDRSWFTSPKFAPYREAGNVKIPCWLQPEKYYAGAAWFQRDIEIPARWADRRVVLFLERAHWETRVWVDGNFAGASQSLSTPHEYDLGQLGTGRHTLTVRVDNRMIVNIGENSHAISDHTQGNWNGIVGKIELRATPRVWIEDLQVYPGMASKSLTVKGRIGNATRAAATNAIVFSIGEKRFPPVSVSWDVGGGDFSCVLPVGDKAELWDEFHPSVQCLTARLGAAERSVTLGYRQIETQGTDFLINGRKTFFRGTLECAIFPKTGHPPTEVAEWRRIIKVAKAYGLNMLRFHSYCPPEAAFQAADALGMYLQVETCWANQSATIGDGKPVDKWVYDETDRILKAYGNHPSFVLMLYGNEPGGKQSDAYLGKYVDHYKARDTRRLWSGGAGWPELSANQFLVTPKPRIQQWGEGLKSRVNARPPETTTDYRGFVGKRGVPVISHEIGQWCVYPNFDEIRKYTGYLKPGNFEIFRDLLGTNGLGGLSKQFLLASGRLQTLCYKEDIESALRTPGMGGFQLLDLHDFPGQGTALVGVLDPFWEEKGYVTAKEYSRFCNATVLLARLPKRVFTTDESLEADVEIAHFGPAPITDGVAKWRLIDTRGKALASGELSAKTIPVGNGLALGHVRAELKRAPAPAQLKFVVSMAGTKIENDWDVWVYPAAHNAPTEDVLVTERLDQAAQHRLAQGGRVLWTIPAARVRNFENDPVALGFSSIFWNTAWTRRQAPTTLGILCDPGHPALAQFPTESHSNWQWWHLIHRAGALRLDLLPRGVNPIVRVIDDWVTARPLALLLEAKVGKGKIIVCGFDLTQDETADPVSRQMRANLLSYMDSKRFKPAASLSVEDLLNLAGAAASVPGK